MFQLAIFEAECECPTGCDCENPEPENGAALVSNECGEHNLYPRKAEMCRSRVSIHKNGYIFDPKDDSRDFSDL